MKTILTIAILLFCYSAFGQDTLSHFEWHEGKKILIREITSNSTFTHDFPRIIAMVLAAVSVVVFIFHKPKPKEDANAKKTT